MGQAKKNELRRVEAERSRRMLWALEQAAVAMADALSPEAVIESIGSTLLRLEIQSVVFRLDPDEARIRLTYLSADSALVRMLEKRVNMTRDRFAVEVDKVDFYRSIIRDRKTEYRESSRDVARQVLPGVAAPLVAFLLKRLGMDQMVGAPLVTGDRVWGAMIISSNELTGDDRAAMQVFAHQVGWALHKVQLLQQLQNTIERLNESQAQLLQAQKMEALGRFTGGIAHDLNNLLTGILMGQELALLELPPDAPARAELELIGETTARAALLISKLLAFSRTQVLQRRRVRLNEVVGGLGSLLRRVLGEDVRLEIDLEGTRREPEIQADVTQIEQVLMNLVVNARDAMPEGGALTIQTRAMTIEQAMCTTHGLPPTAEGTEVIRLSVADTGPGIPEDVLSRIFDPFFTTKDQARGTGLGLSVAYGILAQHDGWLTVETHPSHGTTFHAWLPAAPDSPEHAASEATVDRVPELPSLHGRRVLVVEDDPAVRELAVRGLGRRGVRVITAETIAEARALLDATDIHFVVSDVVLPDGSGAEFCEYVQTARPDVRIILMSGYADDRHRVSHETIEARQWTFLRKPFSTSDLAEAMATSLNSTPG